MSVVVLIQSVGGLWMRGRNGERRVRCGSGYAQRVTNEVLPQLSLPSLLPQKTAVIAELTMARSRRTTAQNVNLAFMPAQCVCSVTELLKKATLKSFRPVSQTMRTLLNDFVLPCTRDMKRKGNPALLTSVLNRSGYTGAGVRSNEIKIKSPA